MESGYMEFHHTKEFSWLMAAYLSLALGGALYMVHIAMEGRVSLFSIFTFIGLLASAGFFLAGDKKRMNFKIEKTEKEIKVTRYYLFNQQREFVYDRSEVMIVPIDEHTVGISYISDEGIPKDEKLYVKEQSEDILSYLKN